MNTTALMNRAPRPTNGFSLIELLVAMAIVAIITAIAYPSYVNYVVRTHRGAAKACLSEQAQFMERFYTSNLTYVGADPQPGCRTQGGLDQRYTFDAPSNVARRTYTLTATPKGTQATRDAGCAVLGLNQDGTRTATGSAGAAYCW